MNIFEELNGGACFNCGEPVREDWKLCPSCEAPLEYRCPQCRSPVKRNWKRCPECEVRLVCPTCNRRIKVGLSGCDTCSEKSQNHDQPETGIIDPVTGIEFIALKRGTFIMGDLLDEGLENEKPLHEVRLDSFHISKYPVTQKQWKSLMRGNNSRFRGGRHPVEQVSWDEVQIFIDRISKTISSEYRVHLPTEAQWEYAARSGGRNEKYAGSDEPDKVAWYNDNSHGSTHPVGIKASNGLGLYDMSGNVWEWCRDNFKVDAYRYHDQHNPVIIGRGRDRVIRGGGWNVDSWSVRCARRYNLPREWHGPGLGFRLVLNTQK